MAFTRPWDDTFPPDTQQANLLGQDIRRDKEDTAERIRAFGGGLIASRETPEADFGNANIGALFYAEDEGKLYRWDGTAWSLISTDRLFSDFTDNNIAAPGAETDGSSVTIPAAFLTVGCLVKIRAAMQFVSTPDGNRFRLYFGTDALSNDFLSSGSGSLVLEADIIVDAAASQRLFIKHFFPAAMTSGTNLTFPNQAISGAIEVKTTMDVSTSTWNLGYLTVEVILQ